MYWETMGLKLKILIIRIDISRSQATEDGII